MSRGKSKADVRDNVLALGQFIDRCERAGISWGLYHDPSKVVPENHYELRVYDAPARDIYRGRTATHAASQAIEALDDYRIGWESP